MRTYIIPIFIPHYGCPHTCVFCNQQKITGRQTDVRPEFIRETIERHLAGITREYCIEVAFYGGSFTALDSAVQRELLLPAYSFVQSGQVHSLRLSTRPDCIDAAILEQLAALGVQTIELGAQSFDDAVLAKAERGHKAAAIAAAAKQIQARGFRLGIQLMPGLPGDSWRTILHSLAETMKIQPDFVRIYPTLVLGGTKLGTAYGEGKYQPLSLAEAVRYAAVMKLLLQREGIQVIRTGLQSSENLDDGQTVLAGPYHPAFGEMVDSYLFYLMVAEVLGQLATKGQSIVVHHAIKDSSRVRGNKNGNKKAWQAEFFLQDIRFAADMAEPGTLAIEQGKQLYRTNLAMLTHF